MKKYIFVTTIIIIVLMNSGCINNSPTEKEKKVDYHFDLILDPSTDSNYSIKVPIPITEDGKQLKLNQNIEITNGTGVLVIEQSKFGLVFNISGNGLIKMYLYSS